MKCYAVDDETHGITMIKGYVNQTPGLLFVGSQTDPYLALEEIKSLQPDIVFTDINMPVMHGIELASMVDHISKIVFISGNFQTSFSNVDWKDYLYLKKPATYKRFLEVISICKKVIVDPLPRHNLKL